MTNFRSSISISFGLLLLLLVAQAQPTAAQPIAAQSIAAQSIAAQSIAAQSIPAQPIAAQTAPAQHTAAQPADTRIAAQCVRALTDVMVHDITSPPVASRSYVYSLIAFYEAACPGDTGYKSFAGRLNELGTLPRPIPGLNYDWLIAGTSAFYRTAYTFVFSKDLFQRSWDSIEWLLRQRPDSKEVFDRSVVFGQQVAAHILEWVKVDHYIHTRTLPRYTPGTKPGDWQQTGPDYMEAIEPHWDQIRPLTLSKAHQFMVPEPAPFGSEEFKKEVKEVYDTSLALSENEIACARFWDCNPYATQTVGHLMYSVKKISPGGHWIGITTEVIQQRRQGLTPALYACSLVGIALFDGFIAAWDEKYRTNYVRPITAIQRTLAPTWEPLLQTPPFPEYPSAHSVISMASARVLTALYGDPYPYTDSVERSFGLPERSFPSFTAAASEAAMSRLYGGIHFREAVVNGEQLGREVGDQIVARLQLTRVAD